MLWLSEGKPNWLSLALEALTGFAAGILQHSMWDGPLPSGYDCYIAMMALIEIDGLPVYLLKMGGSFYGYVK